MNKAKKVLVVVESPAKAKTIEKFLGAEKYIVKASMGHLRDLPKSQFGVDVDNQFSPKYINIRGKGELIKTLKSAAKKADAVLLATDPDREGEAIAWHLANLLNVSGEQNCRIEFNEITKTAVKNAIKKPRPINFPQVEAQQARRILDRIVGYKLSPLLWRKVRKGLSAGRVQSVAVRLICDREREIEAFIPEEYWTISLKLRENSKSAAFPAELAMVDGKKAHVTTEEEAMQIQKEMEQSQFRVTDVKHRDRRRNPSPPFTTSSLQQDAVRKFGYTSRKTMVIAQQLYEGLDVAGKGTVGLITYMRTDSTRIAQSAQDEARAYIEQTYDKQHVPEKPPIYANKKAQDAHEAIRPTYIDLPPEKVEKQLSSEQLRIYKLIWDRFIASQMAPALYHTVTVDIDAGRFRLRSNGSQLKFAGFLRLYSEGQEGNGKEEESYLPDLQIDQNLLLSKITPKQHFTEPPPYYTEASLIKLLEEQGIGRPSTYSPIIETIVSRGYVLRSEKKFRPTDLGFLVTDLLQQYFKDIVDVAFTAKLENQLDEIADGDQSRITVLKEFYDPFSTTLAAAETEIGEVEIPVEVSDVICELCGRNLVVKHGRYGSFLACPGYPACKNTKPIVKDTGVKCPKCSGDIVERKTRRGKVFYGCNQYPQCDFVTWDMPLKEQCKECGAFLVRHNFQRGRFVIRCSNNECPTMQKKETEKPTEPAKKTSPKRRKKSV
ncbi:MAG: topoisomerase [Firmicutes bacterium]|nr:topoisomerase [Bacillota bacterium]